MSEFVSDYHQDAISAAPYSAQQEGGTLAYDGMKIINAQTF